jgi:hypothetical protein
VPLALEYQPVVLGDADRRVARAEEPKTRRGCPPFTKINFPEQNGLICAAVATDSVSEGPLI